MKFYPKQSACPHCKTVYRYSDLNKLKFKKETECYHCRKAVRISKKSLLILLAEMLIICVIVNVVLTGAMGIVNFWIIYVINAVIVLAGVFILPLYIETVKADKKTNKKK